MRPVVVAKNFSHRLAGLALSLCLTMLTLQACSPEPSDASPVPGGQNADQVVAPTPVETLTISTSDFLETFEVMGTTEPFEVVRIAAEMPGIIERAQFKQGQAVKKGDVLYRVDTQVDNARLNVLKSQVATAQRELERTQKLNAEGLATPQHLDQAQAGLESAQLNLRHAQVGLTKATVQSPISGYITHKFHDQGEYAAPGVPLAEIVNYDTIIVKTHVPESNIAYIVNDTKLNVHIPALEKNFEGVVKYRSIQPSNPTRTYPVEIHIPNPELGILPGMRARIVVPKRQWNDVILVPREAILEGVERQEAMVVEDPATKGHAKAQIRTVELGPGQGPNVIVKTGLHANDKLIVRGHRGLVAGTHVEVVHSN